jgi:ketosteroid isomerase-like protein
MPETPRSTENEELARRAWGAVSRGDLDTLGEILSPDVVWHATGSNPWRGDHAGMEEVTEYLGRIGELTATFDATLEDILASEDRALIVFRANLKREGRDLDVGYLLLARIENGRACEVWTAPLDPAAIGIFWADA